jgi:molybdopterin synthase catalytic subunit/molybdopterin converting factor small subunit
VWVVEFADKRVGASGSSCQFCGGLTYSSRMRVRVRLFGPLRECSAVDVWREISEGETVGELLAALRGLPEELLRASAVAVNQEYAQAGRVLQDGDEVAILPPVSGGADAPRVELVRERIDADAIVSAIKAGADGAVCVFDGIVRDNTRGRKTLHLDYEAYEEMALKQMHVLRAEAIEHYGVREVAIVHRLGRLLVGETSVLIVVASAHRGAAFDACRWVIDTLKKTVPIWKKEQFVDGALWADGEPFPEDVAGDSR